MSEAMKPELTDEIVDDFTSDDFVFVQRNEKLHDKVYKTTSYAHDVWVHFKKNKGAVFGLIIIAIIIVMAIIGPMISGYGAETIDLSQQSLPPRIQGLENIGIFRGTEKGVDVYAEKGFTDVYHWFGTDTNGRDLFTRVWEGTRVSLIIAFAAAAIDIVIGMSYGLISGYFGGKVDMVMQRIVEILNGIPTLVVVTLLGLVMPSGISSIVFALMITGWIGMSRISRAEMLKLKESEYVLASRTLGAKSFYIIFKDIMPNIFGQLIIMSMFSIPNAIFTEAFLSFVGLGIQPPQASLGSLISDGYKSMTIHPFILIAPIIVLALLMLSFNLFADGIRDAFDPNQKQG
ncbi:ABC transporter permease [Erysipelotrichaceae bacterium Oil+RF-744-GAM-WT-6]|jgi:oligopeptide transport system permease protein|uniref:ABC transporter permease n=1 Tax=Stecheria intestinalis TaxID=2606630 RepID=A0A7X2NT68_9FIRM|nr:MULTISPECIES: oligopeptide ABC transporter permease [Erysipelotrichaceae]MCI2155167.1 ABC transporter permease [Solobacterium sp.]MDD6365639.1 ABC transporter permease [Stecheria intestinalis]MDD7679824.1 ABC transporter permease [Stecheria intestinalis]MSS59064.1 ABC transporter permease [Stecheria intestinalis]